MNLNESISRWSIDSKLIYALICIFDFVIGMLCFASLFGVRSFTFNLIVRFSSILFFYYLHATITPHNETPSPHRHTHTHTTNHYDHHTHKQTNKQINTHTQLSSFTNINGEMTTTASTLMFLK